MIKSLNTSFFSSRQLNMDVVSNNLANINSSGFKRDVVFTQLLKNAEGMGKSGETDKMKFDKMTDFSQGSLNQTNNPLDIALDGRGFFVIDTPNGTRYTRNGNFKISPEGLLVSTDGFPVMGNNGKIQFPDIQKLSKGKIHISDTGEILIDNHAIAKLSIMDFENLQTLKKDGNSLFKAEPRSDSRPYSHENLKIQQGYLEESNVDGLYEMIRMIELARGFESFQKAVQAHDSLLEKAIEVAKI